MRDEGVTRREALAAGAAIGAAAAVGTAGAARAGRGSWTQRLDFATLGDGDGWPGWACPGAANLRRRGGRGALEAGTDVFPSDPRPVAFAIDRRFRDGEIAAVVTAAGAGGGLVLRRVGPREFYAAILDDEEGALVIVRREPRGITELARAAVSRPRPPFPFSFEAKGAVLTATLGSTRLVGRDDAIRRAGDAGVLATARTLWPSEGPEVLPALGNLHLLPYGVQEGQAVMETAVGEQVLATIRERSTAEFSRIDLTAAAKPAPTRPSVVAATAAVPLRRGAIVRVASDVPARVEIEFALNPRFRRSRRVRVGVTNRFDAVFAGLHGLKHGRRVWWRARLRRRGRVTVGPARSFRMPPAAGSPAPATIAIGSCASQFGPIFDVLAARRPDVFIWQGDLNYPDTAGPLAQTVPGYAGIWRDFLANPRTEPIFARSLFAAQRDDHDYGIQDANSTNLVPWGLQPWEGLIGNRDWYRFGAGVAEFWVLDQRRFKSDPDAPDTADKTLLGHAQRTWLMNTLAASRARFKVVCSPCTLAPLSANRRDGSWAVGFTAERELLLDHIRSKVGGRTIFITGDTHWTMAYDRDGLFEARPCPLGIPAPNDITLTQPQAAEDARRAPGVLYADDENGHFALLEVSGAGLELTLVREDGGTAFQRRFEPV